MKRLTNVLDPAAQQKLLGQLLPMAATLETDHWRVFLALCVEDGASQQRLGRYTGLGQSEVIRAITMLESWSPDGSDGLLQAHRDEASGAYRQCVLTQQGRHLRCAVIAAFGDEHYAEHAVCFYRFLQEELLRYWQQAA